MLLRTEVMAVVAWAAFAAWCVCGTPPCVDLPAHGAQLQVLAELLRGDEALGRLYEAHFSLGYGLTHWLLLPLALAWNGAAAVRVGMWLALVLYPVSAFALARALRRPGWTALLSLLPSDNYFSTVTTTTLRHPE